MTLRRWPLGLCALALCGCASSAPTRLYVISPRPPAALPIGTGAALPPLQVLEVRLPAAFDRLEIVRLGQSDRVELSDFDRWAAPPGALASEAFRRDLAARLPGTTPSPPLGSPSPTARVLRVVVTSLERRPDGILASAVIEVRAPPGDPAAGTWPVSALLPEPAASPERQADLWSQIIAALADQAAERLQRGPVG